ncbi:acetylglutamate kinase [Maribacter confluentis]|uniref:Acetylglutamate kinase n=1 Tax=Maribacter confluentis TaxID=1656093 RepID=A0ABT8RNI2_9FLAO|nr:acetylglutamate kinase [Maribacter confluentis]MDO1512448.1 acetylglutamate kinase [Maribacter confluentis]
MKEVVSIVKIGGNVIEDDHALDQFLNSFSKLKGPKVLIHGGGKLATKLSTRLGIPSNMVDGRRITDKETVDVITMVYAGLANKKIVAQLQSKGTNALGMSGADGNSIQAHKRPVKEIDYGFVGDIDEINSKMIANLLGTGITPVFCAISHDGKGQLLNTNADTIAAEISIAMASYYEVILYYCFEKKGVLMHIEDENSVIEHINRTTYKELLDKGIIADGMLPKLHNCFHALEHNVAKVCLGDVGMLQKNAELFTTITL